MEKYEKPIMDVVEMDSSIVTTILSCPTQNEDCPDELPIIGF